MNILKLVGFALSGHYYIQQQINFSSEDLGFFQVALGSALTGHGFYSASETCSIEFFIAARPMARHQVWTDWFHNVGAEFHSNV